MNPKVDLLSALTSMHLYPDFPAYQPTFVQNIDDNMLSPDYAEHTNQIVILKMVLLSKSQSRVMLQNGTSPNHKNKKIVTAKCKPMSRSIETYFITRLEPKLINHKNIVLQLR